ncbi:stromal membrane-associated protein 1 isoform X2 [Melanotaenia boesemani]|uniref:stromal membrane-associated protein 1 isoform X2 n=1 Tax=Melanotaenia boesemani TaxID=1250792 RepID=UPI001C0489B1|nr:stromal membrane-associated protein 1 isoform X2 [Melanotaenia boesemani]
MTTRSEREKAQKLNEQHQAILSKLLREEDNKYCADCEAKGPRWASWNLGVFMCIRCAGIHRNLGVHISRVKSVNLDQWTPEQIQSMVDMGNTRARQLYEAHLPDSFRRPQTDQAVEVFIRDKYERKKYYDKEALAALSKSSEAPPPSTSPSSQADRNRPEREGEKKKEEKKKEKDADKVERRNNIKQSECRASPKKSSEPAVDLLGLDAPDGEGKTSDQAVPAGNELDIFGPMVSNPLPPNSTQQTQSGSGAAAPQVDPSTSSSSASTSSSSTTTTAKVEEKKLLSKDSILSLYASSSVGSQPQNQQQSAAGQGVYMGQPQMPFTPQGFAPVMPGGVPPSTMMGGGSMMSGMTLPNGSYMAMQQQPLGVVPANQGQNMYNMQQAQWNMSQMTQQMSGMALSSGGPTATTFSQSGPPAAAGWPAAPAPASGQTLSTQLWK